MVCMCVCASLCVSLLVVQCFMHCSYACLLCSCQYTCARCVYVHGHMCWHVSVKDTHQLLLLHALHENDEQMLGLCPAVSESLLDGHQQLVS